MKKVFFLVTISLLFISCNKKLYYEYYNEGNYATLEIIDNFSVIYRSKSNNSNFIYISSVVRYETNDTVSHIDIFSTYWLDFIENGQDKYDLCGFDYKPPNDAINSFITYRIINNDSLVSISEANRNKFLENGSCFVENNVNWLPPYFTRVKKIDYKKFNLPQIKDKYLKDPGKAPKVYDK